MKLIKIETCIECPFRAAGPALADVAYAPRCNNTGQDLPYLFTTKAITRMAAPTNEIPKWCPLTDEEPDPVFAPSLAPKARARQLVSKAFSIDKQAAAIEAQRLDGGCS